MQKLTLKNQKSKRKTKTYSSRREKKLSENFYNLDVKKAL